ncbi:hypothetical protein CNECB9_2610049 [Cupriavidus necator]|uniref:Uncharacterized protein n=1 Tax=Cupriavidus necator TaxID=106590 RepID=A0A1K0ISR9_CUPNE|nr:hypothetical protein CNECB9_2610049 [Cupriavidus necator]
MFGPSTTILIGPGLDVRIIYLMLNCITISTVLVPLVCTIFVPQCSQPPATPHWLGGM